MVRFDESTHTFLSTELNMGLTFCRMALRTKDAAKLKRYRANALEAYKSLLRFSNRASLSPLQAKELQKGIAELKRSLDRLAKGDVTRKRPPNRPYDWDHKKRS